MASGTSEVSIATNPDNVWKLIRDFGGVADYMPGIDSCTVDGDVRTLQMMGIEIKEQLRDLDDDTRRFTYSVIASPMDNLESHEATVAVDPEGTGTHLAWTVTVVPDELLPLFQGAYDGAVNAMKTKFEG
jgi:carbon monoxide dehydrogenase subunit G